LYYVVVEDPDKDVKTPSQSYIRNGRDANNNTVSVKGSFSVSSGATRSEQITGLKGGTSYKIFGCVYESSSSNSLYSKVKSATFTTSGSNVNWITRFDVSAVANSSATLNIAVNRAGRFYYVVTEEGRQPTADNIRNRRDYNNNTAQGSDFDMSANVSQSPTLSSLTQGRTYHVFGVLYSNGEWSEIEHATFTATGLNLTEVRYGIDAVTTSSAIAGRTATISLGGGLGANSKLLIDVARYSGVTFDMSIQGVAIQRSEAGNSWRFTVDSARIPDTGNNITLTAKDANGATIQNYTIRVNR
jgi:hypothetical protein